eukprot:7636797-Lingulodinium_polyedra.AAC.1
MSRQSRRRTRSIACAITCTLWETDQRYCLECQVVYVSSRQPQQGTHAITKTMCETEMCETDDMPP